MYTTYIQTYDLLVFLCNFFSLPCCVSKYKHKFLYRGSFKNYVDKMRWVGGQKMPIFVHVKVEIGPR